MGTEESTDPAIGTDVTNGADEAVDSESFVAQAPSVGIRAIFARFWPDTRSLRVRWLLSLVLVAASPALSAAAIWLFKILVDEVVVPHDFHAFPRLAGAYLALAVVQGIVSFGDQYLSVLVGERFVLRLRARLFDQIHHLSAGFLERRHLGDVLSRLTGDIEAIEEVLLSGVAQGLGYLFEIVWFGAALFLLDWRLAAASLVAAPVFLGAARWFSSRIRDASREKRRRAASITSVAEESFANAALVRAYGRAGSERERFAEQNLGSLRAQMAATRLQALFGPLTDLTEVVGVLLVIGLAVWELAQGRITIGGLLAFVAYLTQLYGPIQGIGQLLNSVYAASAGAERVIEFLDAEPAVTDPEQPTPLGRATGAITLRDVTFGYPDAPAPTLRDIDLTIRPGERVAVVGASGAGKSTLLKLLLRFHDPSTGSITIDGIDLRELALDDLYRNIATVLQETLVFDATVRENIRWGRPDASDSEVEAAATAADAHEFIVDLPQGYDTRVGQRGRLLSGGQRQRMAIARAMIRDAPVLLLDEPTTGLDGESGERVLEPLRRLMSGRTTIIISHNLRAVADADRIFYLEHGRVAGVGSHAQLLAEVPGYARLARSAEGAPTPPEADEQLVAGDPDDLLTRPLVPVVARPALAPSAGNEPAPSPLEPSFGGDEPAHSTPSEVAAAIPVPDGAALVLDRVRLNWPNREETPAEVSTEVFRGGCLVVLGPDGSGTSAMLRVMAGLEQPAAGTVRSAPATQAVLAEVPVELVAGTVAENIRLGAPQAGPAEVVAAAMATGLHEVVAALPHAYATRVVVSDPPFGLLDTRRLMLARALLGAPDILLLDDPTAGLDKAGRNALLAVLCDVAAGRTMVIATNDPVVAAIADQRLRLTHPDPPPTVAFHPVPRRRARGVLTRG